MHTVLIQEVTGQYKGRGWRDELVECTGVIGLRAIIMPPVDLTPQAVEHFLWREHELQRPMLLGTTGRATVIFDPLARSGGPVPANQRETLASATLNLLGVMGVDACIAEAEGV